MAASGDDVLRPHGKESGERIGVTRMCDDTASRDTAYGGGATRSSSIGRMS